MAACDYRPLRSEQDLEDYYAWRERSRLIPDDELERLVAESRARREEAAVRWDAWWATVLEEQPELKNGPPLPNPYRT